MKEIRCAIYTRKSHEEGLDQEYNSLDAQRDACESYIKSQSHEGWTLVKKNYDDGGFSGGNLKRPALQQLLKDIQNDEVDVIVVYKIDRLTRSLMDFSNIIEVLDKSEASFVSVTQHFNTTSSMGRLTLNVLLSFAQFEREITGERIRDKIAASKKKGMWMGGCPPMGYDVVDKKLEVNPVEAKKIKTIFERYVALGSVTDLVKDLKDRNITTKKWTSSTGKAMGGRPYQRGALYNLLQNRLYLGEMPHKDKSYPGEHKAIIYKPLWDAVQKQLESNRRRHKETKAKRKSCLLKGLIYDSKDNVMSPSYSVKKGNRRYPYYVSAPLNGKRKVPVGEVPRVPSKAIDDLIRDRLATIMNLDNHQLIDRNFAKRAIRKLTVFNDFVELEIYHSLSNVDCSRLKGNGDTITEHAQYTHVRIPATLRKYAMKLTFINPAGNPVTTIQNLDSTLIKNVALAFKWRESIEAGTYSTHPQIAHAENCTERFIRKVLPFAYLAPDIIESILNGTQPAIFDYYNFQKLPLPIDWHAQRKLFGYTA
jgi:site-specific DNA recombinase